MAAGLYDITNEILGKGHFAIVKLARHCLTGKFFKNTNFNIQYYDTIFIYFIKF